jgi:hypothetical protein
MRPARPTGRSIAAPPRATAGTLSPGTGAKVGPGRTRWSIPGFRSKDGSSSTFRCRLPRRDILTTENPKTSESGRSMKDKFVAMLGERVKSIHRHHPKRRYRRRCIPPRATAEARASRGNTDGRRNQRNEPQAIGLQSAPKAFRQSCGQKASRERAERRSQPSRTT